MRRRPIIALALASAVALGPWASAAEPQVTDKTGDGNLTGQSAPVGNQAYADAVSALWENVTKDGKPAMKVTLTLAGAPTPPSETGVVYRLLGSTPSCKFFGVVYYTQKSSDKKIPQAAVRDNCIDATTRLTEIPLPEIKDSTITWTVPLSVFPADTKVKSGTTLENLYIQINEVEDFRGVCLPDDGGVTGLGGACGLGFGEIDRANSTNSFKIS